MTSDFIQSKHVSRSARATSGALELTREDAFVDGAHDMFDVLAQHNQQQNLMQGMSATISFLENARIMLRHAEEKISEQKHRLSQLEHASWIDPLTGLLNARGFSKTLLKEVARTNRGYNEGGLLVMFNLENFDSIKNKHGEETSRTALRMVSQALEQEIRDMDSAAHISDNEFVLLFSDTSMAEALSRLQNMALRLNRLSLICDGEEIRLNLSLGLKSYKKGAKAEQIFKDASSDLQRNRKDAAT